MGGHTTHVHNEHIIWRTNNVNTMMMLMSGRLIRRNERVTAWENRERIIIQGVECCVQSEHTLLCYAHQQYIKQLLHYTRHTHTHTQTLYTYYTGRIMQNDERWNREKDASSHHHRLFLYINSPTLLLLPFEPLCSRCETQRATILHIVDSYTSAPNFPPSYMHCKA